MSAETKLVIMTVGLLVVMVIKGMCAAVEIMNEPPAPAPTGAGL